MSFQSFFNILCASLVNIAIAASKKVNKPYLKNLDDLPSQKLRQGERRERDSNPRTPCGVNGFRDRPVQPLWHLSIGQKQSKATQSLFRFFNATIVKWKNQEIVF